MAAPNAPVLPPPAGPPNRDEPPSKASGQVPSPIAPPTQSGSNGNGSTSGRMLAQVPLRESFRDAKFRIQQRVISDLDPKLDLAHQIEVRREIEEGPSRALDEEGPASSAPSERACSNRLPTRSSASARSNRCCATTSVSEVMVIGPRQSTSSAPARSSSPTSASRRRPRVRVIERIVTPLGRRIDESTPMVDARLDDGSRVNAIIPPLACGPLLTIRKFSAKRWTDDLIGFGTSTPEMAEFLRACVEARLNILVSGGTGSGKTTLLNVLSSFIPDDERIVTIEDAAELQLHQEHVVTLETRPPNIEGKGEVPIRDLVRNALRMRPDRIIVGECRGGEALDMLQAMNTGHDGSMTTATPTRRATARPSRDDGPDGGRRPAAARDSRADRLGLHLVVHRTGSRTARARSPISPRCGHGRRRHHAAGRVPVQADRRGRRARSTAGCNLPAYGRVH